MKSLSILKNEVKIRSELSGENRIYYRIIKERMSRLGVVFGLKREVGELGIRLRLRWERLSSNERVGKYCVEILMKEVERRVGMELCSIDKKYSIGRGSYGVVKRVIGGGIELCLGSGRVIVVKEEMCVKVGRMSNVRRLS